jgi:hypothetical protein
MHNLATVRKAVEIALRTGCGTIHYHQPSAEDSGELFLSTAGAPEREEHRRKYRIDSRYKSWSWYEVDTLLRHECNKKGLTCPERKKDNTKNDGNDDDFHSPKTAEDADDRDE